MTLTEVKGSLAMRRVPAVATIVGAPGG